MLLCKLKPRYSCSSLNSPLPALHRRALATAAAALFLPTTTSRPKMLRAVSASDGRPAVPAAISQVALQVAASAVRPAIDAGACLSKPVLLVSDLDDTLLGLDQHPMHDSATAAFKAMWDRSRALGVPCKLAINTGRTLALFEQVWSSRGHLLPKPDIIIAGVGTRIYYDAPTAGWVEDKVWTCRMNDGWDSRKAKTVIDHLLDSFGKDNVVWREPVEMHEHKFTVLYRADLRGQLLPELQQGLKQAGVRATIIEGGSAGNWRFIDLLPAHAGKGAAMQYVQQHFLFDSTSTVAAGDSCNDLLMLQQSRLSIVVGNSVPEVKDWASSVAGQPQKQQQQQQQHGAEGAQPCVYVAQQPVAAGVIEGLHALGFMHTQEA